VLVLIPVGLVGGQSRSGYVYDFADILFTSEIETIESLCNEIDVATSAEVVVVTLSDLEGFGGDINAARLEYFNEISLDGVTGIGKEGVDNGVLIIVALEEREWAFEIGYGVEGDLTDSESGRIGREVIVPYFQEGDYYSGLFIAVGVVGGELGYNVSDFDNPVGSVFEDPDLFDILFDDDPWLIFWWLFGSGENFLIVFVLIIVLIALFGGGSRWGGRRWGGRSGGGRSGGGGRRGGGRSGGGGSKGKW
jgi:uncharacterized protein